MKSGNLSGVRSSAASTFLAGSVTVKAGQGIDLSQCTAYLEKIFRLPPHIGKSNFQFLLVPQIIFVIEVLCFHRAVFNAGAAFDADTGD
jgi:hypothetical protein